MKFWYLLLSLALLGACGTVLADRQPVPVDFCHLTAHWKLYVGTLLKTDVVVVQAYHGNAASAPGCTVPVAHLRLEEAPRTEAEAFNDLLIKSYLESRPGRRLAVSARLIATLEKTGILSVKHVVSSRIIELPKNWDRNWYGRKVPGGIEQVYTYVGIDPRRAPERVVLNDR